MYKLTYRSLFRKSSMLRKLLLSMIGLICIPLILIQLFTIQRSTEEFHESQDTRTLSYLQSINASFEQRIEELSAYSLKISNTDEIKYPLQEGQEAYKLYLAASKLKEYNTAYPLVQCVGIYYLSADTVIYDGFSYSLKEFNWLFFPNDPEKNSEFHQFFQNTKGTAFFSGGMRADGNPLLLFARSVPIGGRIEENAVVFFVIDDSRLEQWCSSFLPQSAGFSIRLSSGQELFHTGQPFTQLTDRVDFLEFSNDLNRHIFTLNDEHNTLIYKYRSPDSPYIIFAAMPQNVINQDVNRYMLQVRMALLLTFFVTIIFTAVTAYINYKPIVKLLHKHAVPAMENSAESELALLESAFFLRDEQISNQDNLIRTFLISDLLAGDQVDSKKLDRYFPKNQKTHFVVSLTDVMLSTAQSSMLIERVQQIYEIRLLVTTIPKRKETIFIFYSEDAEKLNLPEEKLNKAMLMAIGFECGFVSGSVVSDVHSVIRSYQDAIDKYNEATAASQFHEPYPAQQIQQFGNDIRRNNLDEALALMDQLRSRLGMYNTMYQRMIGFDLLRTYIHNAPEQEFTDQEFTVSPENVPLMFAVLRSAIEKRQSATESTGKDMNREMKTLLIEYVNANCLNSDICLTAAADYLNTSIYTVSRLFKEATGMGFKDYITSKRLKHACHLLKDTNLSVNAIAAECGFERLAYFSNLFKNEYGVAPSIYRSNNR